MAIALTLVGALVSAGEIPDPVTRTTPPLDITASEPERASAQVPIRSTDPNVSDSGVDSVRPSRVWIASIGLDAEVLPVGVDDQQQFDVPAGESVGWYRFGAAPSDDGSTVLAAHVDFGGRQGAFFNLASVEQGDTLHVQMEDGSTLRYRVVDNVLYDKADLPADELFRRSGDPILRLITCGGSFDPEHRTYRGNVVVSAIPVHT